MHTSIKYADYPPARRYEQAVTDARAWLRWNEPEIRRNVRRAAGEGTTIRQLINLLGLVGIQGLPARRYILDALRTE